MNEYIKKIYCLMRYRKLLKLGERCNINIHSKFEGKNYIGKHSFFKGNLGYGSYIGDNSIVSGKIGRFCCIGNWVYVISGTHPSRKFVSTYPAFYSKEHSTTGSYVNAQKFDEFKYADSKQLFPIIIGNDVWIGTNAMIMAGIKIGDGAIVGAGSIVTKDVTPYSIVVGAPAYEIRKRFSDEEIKWLLEFKWWEKPIDWIEANANDFDDIEYFMEKYK